MLCDDIIEKGYNDICINILNQAALDYRSNDVDLQEDVLFFLESDWFILICDYYSLDIDKWRELILNKNILVKNKLLFVEL